MPGRSLNVTERRLLQLWQNPPAGWSVPTLRSIEIGGGTGIRGINGLLVPFRFPLTAICGNNGVGKSTVLNLAALAHHSPPDWRANPTQPQLGARPRTGSYYRFSDFFLRGPGDQDYDDVSVTWRYFLGGREVSRSLRKKRSGWGAYRVRPTRETVFVPISRILPAYEISGVRSAFVNPVTQVSTEFLDSTHRQLLSFVMGREYTSAEVQNSRRHTFQRCESGRVYTAFNMGSGESCIIGLLYVLQHIPAGGLVVVEEVELGLHPQAQLRLAEVLLGLCLSKRLQVVCSTHSEVFLDALPRPARLLLKRSEEGISTYEAPSTRFAMYEMTGAVQPEIIVYCEDRTASTLIQEALSSDTRVRVTVREVGSDATVIRQGVSHLRSGSSMRALCVLDGDTTQEVVDSWLRSETGGKLELNPDYMFLPGTSLPPEKWILEQIRHTTYRDEFAKQFGCGIRDAQSHIEALAVELDHHNLGYVLHQRTNLDESDCMRRVMRSFAARHPQLDPLRERIAGLLA